MDFSHQQHGSGDLEIWDDMKPSYVRWGQTDVAIPCRDADGEYQDSNHP